MSLKLNHYAQPVQTNVKSLAETAFIEFALGLIAGGFAWVSYDEIIQLFIGCLAVALTCFALTLMNIYSAYRMLRDNKPEEPQI